MNVYDVSLFVSGSVIVFALVFYLRHYWPRTANPQKRTKLDFETPS
jgi:hypothetical protein